MEEVLKIISEEKNAFESQAVTIVPGFTFNQKNTLEKIFRYYNSRFEGGDIDADGDKKYFYNIVRNPCKVTTKAIDFDTKHIKVLTAAGGTELKTWFFEIDLQHWMRENNFGRVLNRIFEELPIYGSVVLKVIKNKPYFVDLRNFIVNQSADTLDDSGYIIEKHYYTPIQFRKEAQKLGWKNVEKAVAEFYKMKDVEYICVWERYGEVNEGTLENPKYVYKRVMVADVGVDEVDKQTNLVIPHRGIELDAITITKHPYYEFHMEKIPGRWLGVGMVEILFDPQIGMNSDTNLQSKAAFWAAVRLWQSRDQAAGRNLATDVKNGQVLTVDSEITQVDMTDRNLAFFNDQFQKRMKNISDLTFSYDVMQGERLPAGTPLGSAKLAASMAASYFDQLRENIALDIKELLYNEIIPGFKKENTKEHEIRLVGENLDKLNKLITNIKQTDELFNYIAQNNELPDQEEYEMMGTLIGEMVKQKTERIITIPGNFYENLKYKIVIEITGEEKDTQTMTQVIFAALQAITADPMLLKDPQKKKIFFKGLEYSGVNPEELVMTEPPTALEDMAAMTPQRGAGGGVSAPLPIGETTNLPNATTNTI